MTTQRIRRALLSVSDKTGLIEFATTLKARGIELVLTCGTAATLKAAGLVVMDISELTGFPEMMDGRVKTLHPKVHGGILAIRGNDSHDAAAREHNILPIDLLVVNLYPFESTVAKDASYDDCVKNIDVGGPAMIRSAAKNHDSVTVIVEPSDYDRVLAEIVVHDGATTLATRKALAAKAFARTAAYDAAISNWFAHELKTVAPEWRAFGGHLGQVLRYGENPHQTAALYLSAEPHIGVATAMQLQGKELSYNNINDTDAALELVSEFDPKTPAVAIIKHANPCGVAMNISLAEAYRRALACDPVSAFGGIVALNKTIDAATAEEMTKIFTEVVIAPDATEDAKAIFAGKKNLRLLLTGGLADSHPKDINFKSLAGGFLTQSCDASNTDDLDLRVVTNRAPTKTELKDLRFAFRVAKHVKSNAIVYAKNEATVGVGAGQMSRVESSRIAVRKAADAAKAQGRNKSMTIGSVVASDAFFPFADGLIAAAEGGVTAVIQPGGSMRDDEVISAADERSLAMVFTGIRHFRH